ncbi:MAG: hypothetical protein HZB95_08075 [Nitrosomonadales bacterium]|nr:hypothetical protein [Nitrosomonadales bacterium]
MKHIDLVLIVITAASLTACASKQADTGAPASAPASKTAPAKESARKEAAPEGAIVGKPAAGSKFAKLKIGMTLAQVEKLIGPPTKQWQHPTAKASIPFYFGPDRWVLQYSYKGEGILTLNAGEDQLLTRIEVNKAE